MKTKDYEFFKREILQAYGHHHVLTFDALEKLQLFQARGSVQGTPQSRTIYSNLRKLLRLIVDEVNEHDPDDISYVYSGYAPLSVRLVQCVIQKQFLHMVTKVAKSSNINLDSAAGPSVGPGSTGWKGFEEALRNVKGKTFDEVQRGEDKAVRARMILNGQNEKRMTIVFFLGGCTFTEIAALRFIGKKQAGSWLLLISYWIILIIPSKDIRNILIATTNVTNGNKMMRTAIAVPV